MSCGYNYKSYGQRSKKLKIWDNKTGKMVRKKTLMEYYYTNTFDICWKSFETSWSAIIMTICWQVTLESISYKSWLPNNTISWPSAAISKIMWRVVTSVWFQRQWDISYIVTCSCYQYRRTNRKNFLWISSPDYQFQLIGKVKYRTQFWLSLIG